MCCKGKFFFAMVQKTGIDKIKYTLLIISNVYF